MTELVIPENHPRAESLRIRQKLIRGFERGLVSVPGLMAHGRGEAFDYILGERTLPSAKEAQIAGIASLLSGEKSAISVNGNVAALCGPELVKLAQITGSAVEVNLFNRSSKRERAIASALKSYGAKKVLGLGGAASSEIAELASSRRKIDPRGIASADVVLVPLEDGDRTMALRRMDKTVIAIDLNPLSRTAQHASVTIVDNIVRTIPAFLRLAGEMKEWSQARLLEVARNFDNRKILSEATRYIHGRLATLDGKEPTDSISDLEKRAIKSLREVAF